MINFDTFKINPPDFKEVSRLTVSEGQMQKKTVMKSKFSQIDNKMFCFADSITSLTHTYRDWLILKEKMGKGSSVILGRKKKPYWK